VDSSECLPYLITSYRIGHKSKEANIIIASEIIKSEDNDEQIEIEESGRVVV